MQFNVIFLLLCWYQGPLNIFAWKAVGRDTNVGFLWKQQTTTNTDFLGGCMWHFLSEKRYGWEVDFLHISVLIISTLETSVEDRVCKQCRSRWAGSHEPSHQDLHCLQVFSIGNIKSTHCLKNGLVWIQFYGKLIGLNVRIGDSMSDI